MRCGNRTCALSAGCSSNDDSGSAGTVAASAVAAAAAERSVAAPRSLLAPSICDLRPRLTLNPQLCSSHADGAAAEHLRCWGCAAGGGELGGRLGVRH